VPKNDPVHDGEKGAWNEENRRKNPMKYFNLALVIHLSLPFL
jgi:hypothetical protein